MLQTVNKYFTWILRIVDVICCWRVVVASLISPISFSEAVAYCAPANVAVVRLYVTFACSLTFSLLTIDPNMSNKKLKFYIHYSICAVIFWTHIKLMIRAGNNDYLIVTSQFDHYKSYVPSCQWLPKSFLYILLTIFKLSLLSHNRTKWCVSSWIQL